MLAAGSPSGLVGLGGVCQQNIESIMIAFSPSKLLILFILCILSIDIFTNIIYYDGLYMKPPADSGRDSIRRI